MNLGRPQAAGVALAASLVLDRAIPGAHIWVELGLAACLLGTAGRPGSRCDLLRLLHGPHRTGLRLVMILLSQQGWTAVTVAELLGCDPRTVRRWVHRSNAHGPNALADRPRSGRPRLGSRRLSARIRRLLGH